VLQFFTADGYKVTARPSGTEPKIKFYIGLKSPVSSLDDIKVQSERLGIINDQILKDLLGE
jgi:phosphoglucomutase